MIHFIEKKKWGFGDNVLSHKKTLLLFIFFILSDIMLAQKSIYLSIYGMPQRTFMYDNSKGDNAKAIANSGFFPDEDRTIYRKPSYSIAYGFLLKYSLNKKMLFGFGLHYAPHQQKYRVAWGNYNGDIVLKYLKLPVFVQYNYVSKKRFNLFVSGGPQLSMLISEKGNIPTYYKSWPLFDVSSPGDVYNAFTIDGMISTGSEILLYKNISLFTQIRFDYSFTQVEKKDAVRIRPDNAAVKIFEYPNVTLKSIHNISAGVSTGITVKMK